MDPEKELFEIQPYDNWDKDIWIYGPGEFRFRVDYDDCNQEDVEAAMRKTVELLNLHWNDHLL